MSVSNSGNTKFGETFLRYFPSLNMGGLTRINRSFPRKFSVAVTAFTILARFAFSKFLAIKEQIVRNQQKKSIEKTPVPQHNPQHNQVEQHPVQPEPMAIPLVLIQPAVEPSKTTRTWALRREQLLSSKI